MKWRRRDDPSSVVDAVEYTGSNAAEVDALLHGSGYDSNGPYAIGGIYVRYCYGNGGAGRVDREQFREMFEPVPTGVINLELTAEEKQQVARCVRAGQQPNTFDHAVSSVTSDLRDLLVRKQRDYGHGNILAFGEPGVLVRVSDKVERLKNLHKIGKLNDPQNESVNDTWMDLANYAIIALMLRRGTFELPLEAKE